MNRVGVGTRLLVFARSVLMLAMISIGVPTALLFAAQERFGGGSPFAGVASPSTWSLDRIGSALSDRLTDRTIADIVIRVSLVVAWVAVIVIVLTVAAELAHMVRHDGLAMPDIRGLGVSQRTARTIAAGLLVIIPLFTSPGSAIARPGASLVAELRTPVSIDAADHLTPSVAQPAGMAGDQFSRAPSQRPAVDGEYVVRSGDSVFGIAERMAGPERAAVAAYAEALIDANLGRLMPDGRTFDNAAFLDVGWVLELPAVPTAIRCVGPRCSRPTRAARSTTAARCATLI